MLGQFYAMMEGFVFEHGRYSLALAVNTKQLRSLSMYKHNLYIFPRLGG